MAKKIATPGNPVDKQASSLGRKNKKQPILARNLSVQAEVEVAMEDKTDLKIGFPASPGSR